MNDDKQSSAGTDELSERIDVIARCIARVTENKDTHAPVTRLVDAFAIIAALQNRERALQAQVEYDRERINSNALVALELDRLVSRKNDRIVQLEDRERELREENDRLSGLLRDGQSVLNAANYTIDNQRESIRANEIRIGELEADLEATRLERDSAEAYKVRTVEVSRSGHDEMLAKLLLQLADERALSTRMFERVAGLSRALDSYGDHMNHCGATVTREEKDCSCGLAAALGDAK